MKKKINAVVMEKPDRISFEDIHELLWKANQKNREDGFVLSTSNLSGEKLQKRLGPDGKCFVALVEDRLVGTVSIRFIKRNAWYSKEKIADYMLAAVDPDYQGYHINSLLSKAAFDYVREKKCNIIELDTAEGNTNAIKIYEHYGFIKAGYKANPKGDHYSVIMVKWLNGNNPARLVCRIHYWLKKLYIRTKYTPGKEKK